MGNNLRIRQIVECPINNLIRIKNLIFIDSQFNNTKNDDIILSWSMFLHLWTFKTPILISIDIFLH
jgi:hypothetical protein